MSEFYPVAPADFNESAFKLIGKDWMLITVKKPDGTYNTMTASWGGIGHLWNRDVCFAFIRPERYTFDFAECDSATWTFTFFGEEYRPALAYCGKMSGRDADKVKECNLTPVTDDDGNVYFDEARCVITAKKLYADTLREECFTDKEQLRHYKDAGFHKVYVCEITKILKK